MSLANGQHNYTVYAIDQYGNANNSGWRYFNAGADTTAPTYSQNQQTTLLQEQITNFAININDEYSIKSKWGYNIFN